MNNQKAALTGERNATRKRRIEREKEQLLEAIEATKERIKYDPYKEDIPVLQEELLVLKSDLREVEKEARWSLRDEGRNPDGTGESYGERNV